jgi:hypothetical protein
VTISYSVFLRNKNVSDEVIEKIKTTFHVQYGFTKNLAIYEIMWKTFCGDRQATDDRIIRLMRVACWITTATNTNSAYVPFFQGKKGYAKAPLCYVVRMTPLLSSMD